MTTNGSPHSRRMSHGLIFGLIALFSASALAADPPAAGAAGRIQSLEPDRAQLERRFESVGTLITKSTAARQIEASGDTGALARHEHAKKVYADAREALAAGDLAKASNLLSSASMVMFEAARMAAPASVTADKEQADFKAKFESVKALLGAQKRIAGEKSNTKEAQESAKQIESLISEAERQSATGQIDTARATIERAYLLAKASISSMRSGDTLVRSLNFATKEEEYHYEIDRNDTHQMLIKVLLEDKPGSAPVSARVKEFLDKAGALRGEAEAAASRGDFATGIETLERSTSEIVKAIRSSGIYIPG